MSIDTPTGLTRRRALALTAASLAPVPVLAQGATAPPPDAPSWRHALSLFGEPRYRQGFDHFAYVNPAAPKGGVVRLGLPGTFDSFNPAVSGIKGVLEQGVLLAYETLLTPSLDEPGVEYGLLAEAVSHPPDWAEVRYRLNPAARWQDGRPVTVADVLFSFESLKRLSPLYGFYYRNVTSAEQTGEREVRFGFDRPGNRELPQIVGGLYVLPKHWWEGRTADGTPRDVGSTSLEPPLGSGPYRLKSFEVGRDSVWARDPDHWARDLPAERGRNNFDEVRYTYYRDATVLLEAFKADAYDFRVENSARNWSRGYDFPAVREKRVVLEEFDQRDRGIMQAFVLNARRPRLADPRVRRALNLAFDFEELNRTSFFGLYERVNSYFHGTELASSDLPEGAELAVLEPLRGGLPAELFTTAYANPVGGTPEAVRANLREASRLLAEAGYRPKDGRLVEARTGEPFTLELLGDDANDERVFLPYAAALNRLGIDARARIVDAAQYQNRLRSFDYDVITASWAQSLSPGNEQREYWGSTAAERPGSRNLAGVRSPVVDALIERIVYAGTREELVAATRALDRVLLWGRHVVPQWTSRKVRTARWDRFARPTVLPAYGGPGFPTVWWRDPAKGVGK